MIMSLPDGDTDQDWKTVATSLAGMRDCTSRLVHTKLLEESSRINGAYESSKSDMVTALLVQRNKPRFHNKKWTPYDKGPSPKTDGNPGRCRYPLCREIGHWEKDCPLRQEHANEARDRESGSSDLRGGSANVAVKRTEVRKWHL
ncbi:hypothetical protein FRC03_007407 [Tulasnella sp. 419]|nr:hypothetical protein FRC03_007407 [Tulasnella sp. 419]